MPDASRARRFDDDFQPTHQLGLPAELDPNPLLDLTRAAASPAPQPLRFAGPEHAERERKDRLARAALRERIESDRHAVVMRMLKKAREESYADGHAIGRRNGYASGWWWGLGYGLMVGCALTYLAVKVGMAFGA